MSFVALVTCLLLRPTGGFVGGSYVEKSLKQKQAVTIVEETKDFDAVARCFVDNFWADKSSNGRLTGDQRRRLLRDQVTEFQRRYGRKSERRQTALFVARSDSEVFGCAGVEMEKDADGQQGAPVMSNLAVARTGRRKGLAQKLVRSCEAKTLDWKQPALSLVVEEQNTKARRLYKKLGYKVVEKDAHATTLTPLTDGRLLLESTTTLTMRRNLLLPDINPLFIAAIAAGGVYLQSQQLLDGLLEFSSSS